MSELSYHGATSRSLSSSDIYPKLNYKQSIEPKVLKRRHPPGE